MSAQKRRTGIRNIPFQIDLPQDFVDEHATELQSGLSTVCVRDGTIDGTTVPGQVVIPEGADLELIAGGRETDEDEGLGLGSRTLLVVRVLGTAESPDETVEHMQGAVFWVGKAAVGELSECPIRALLLFKDERQSSFRIRSV